MIKLFSFALMMMLSLQLFAQRNLFGKVVDIKTGNAIVAASVFLSNTSIGTVTNDKGEFTIANFPNGKFDLVVSCLSYETSVQTIESNNISTQLTIKLKDKPKELNEVIVGATEELTWDKWGDFFIQNFIGTSAFASDCKIKNTEVIKFRRDKKTQLITAYADEALIIENESLGYIIKYKMEDFEYDNKQRRLYFAGYPLFQEMSNNRERIIKRWKKNREEAYYGSMMHFMRTIYRNKIAEENFEVRRLKKVPNYEKQRIKKVYRENMQKQIKAGKLIIGAGNSVKDSSAYYNRILEEPDEKSFLINTLLTGDSIAYALDSVTVMLAFPDYLHVIYKNKKEPTEYLSFLRQNRAAVNISSELTVTEQGIEILANGNAYPPANIMNFGFWSWWEKIATMLPFDYWPSKKIQPRSIKN